MPPKKEEVPDAWDDDWEAQADKTDQEVTSIAPEEPAVASKAERLAKHAEQQKSLWESAYVLLISYTRVHNRNVQDYSQKPEPFHYLAAQPAPPLKAEFKPALKLLSRKPTPRTVTVQDPVTGISRVKIIDDDEDGEDMKRNVLSAEERRIRAQKEREEKQRKYEEVRARLFGTDAHSGSGKGGGSGTSSPGSESEGRGGRSRGRGRAARGIQDIRRTEGRGDGLAAKELYDPNSTPRPVSIQKRGGVPSSGTASPKLEEQVIRAPKGPDGNGRGGFVFGNRGGKAG